MSRYVKFLAAWFDGALDSSNAVGIGYCHPAPLLFLLRGGVGDGEGYIPGWGDGARDFVGLGKVFIGGGGDIEMALKIVWGGLVKGEVYCGVLGEGAVEVVFEGG